MIQGEGTNPQAGKVTVDEFAAKIKEKYPEYKDVDNLKLAQAIVEKYPEYKEAVIFEPTEPVKKKDGNIPSASLDGESPSSKPKDDEPTVGDWWGDKWNSLIEGVSDFMYYFNREQGATRDQVLEFVQLSKEKYPELYKSYEGYLSSDENISDKMAATLAYTDYWKDNPEIDNEVVPFIRQRRREKQVEDTGVKIDQAVQKKLDDQFLSSAVSGLASSIPAMVTSGVTMGGSFVSTSYYSADENLKRTFAENPDLEMTAAEQEAYKITVAGIEGILEKVGLSGALKGNPLIKKILYNKTFTRLANMAGETTQEGFEKVVKEELDGLSGYIKKVSLGSLSEFETGALQNLSIDVINEMTNAVKGQEIFTPKTGMEIIEDAIYAGAQEAVGGGIISGTVGAFSNNNIVTQEDFDKAETLINTIDVTVLERDLKKRVEAGKLDQAQANNILQTAKEFKDVYAKIPEGLGPNARRRMYQLINKKMNLMQSVAGKDDAIQKKVKEQVSEIDTEIVKIYEASGMTEAQRKESGIDILIDDPSLDPYSTLTGKEANEFYSKFTQEDRDAVTELNKEIRSLYDQYEKSETDEQKQTVRSKINELRNKKVSIESKYDDSKKETGVSSTQQKGTEPSEKEDGSDLYSNLLTPDEGTDIYGAFSEEDASSAREIDDSIRDLYQKLGLTDNPEEKEQYKKEILDARSRKLEIENRYSEEPAVVKEPAVEEPDTQKRIQDNQVPVKREVIKITSEDGTYVEYTVTTMLDGSLKADAVSYDENGNELGTTIGAKLADNDIIQRDGLTSLDAVKLSAAEGDVVTVESTQSGEDFMNPKKLDRLSPEQKKKLGIEVTEEVAEDVVEEPTQEVDTEAIDVEENTIADAEFRIEDLNEEINIEKGNIKEAKEKAKEDTAAVRKTKLSKEDKAERIEEIKAELQDNIDEINGNIGIYKEDINALKSDIRKANKRVAKLTAVTKVKAPDVSKVKTPTEATVTKKLQAADQSVKKFGDTFTSVVENFGNLVAKLGGESVPIYVVDEATYKESTGKDSRGSFTTVDGKKAILVNADKATLGTVYHEMMHAYISSMKIPPKQTVSLANTLKSELRKGNAKEKQLANRLDAFQKEYIEREIYGKGLTMDDPNIAEEFLSEFVGQIKDGIDVNNMSLSTIDKIRLAVAKFINNILNDKIDTSPIQSRQEAFDFIENFLGALEGRTEVTAKANPERSAIINSKNPYQASRFQIEVPVGSRIANEPLKDARSIAISYMESKGLKHTDGKLITKLDEKLAKGISDAYIAMKNNPKDAEVAAAYKAMAEETLDQHEAIIKAGYKVEVNNNEPYNNSNELIEDLRKNKNMRIFSTDSGFGDEGITAQQRKDNPMLAETKYKDTNGRTLLVNDIFRFVHDFFGHAERGNGFGPIGEENAWDVHSRMFSPIARKALTAETRGQNSYVNFSGVNTEAFKLRDKGRSLRKEGKLEEAQEFTNKAYAMMKYAPQKVGLLPDEFVENPYLEEVQESEPISREQIDAVNIISADTPKQKAKKEAVAEVLNGFAESQLPPNSSEQDLVSRFLNNIFEESLYTLKKGPRESGMTWYIEDITEFEKKMTVLLPELSDPNQMKLFKQILAITSSGTNPNQNLQTAYTLWVRSNGSAVNFAKNWGEDKISFITKKGVAIGTGIIVRETKTKYVVQKVDALGKPEVFKNGTPKLFEVKKSELKAGYPKPAGFTARGNIVAKQLTKIEKVYDDVGKDINKLIEFFENPQPVSELRKYNKGVPDVDGNVRKIAVGKRNGAFIFGEKIGAFYQNMIGIGDTITMDLWWSRTWNRYMGTMLSTVDNEKVIQETPRTDRERDIMRKAVTLAAKKLNLDVSELQAVIWYFEQELWTKAGNVSPSFSYVTATDALNYKIKTDEQTQKRFSEAGADLTAAEKRRQDAIARANNIIAEGGIQGDVVREQIDWESSEFGKGQVNPAIVNRTTPVQEAASDLLQGKITNAEYQEIVRITQPIEAITKFYLPASSKDMLEALDSNKGKLLNVELEDGTIVGLRLDIPAYKNRNIWIVSVHRKGASGKSLTYGSVAWATNVQFGSNPKVAAFIAAGKNMDTLEKQNKSTIARMHGEWKNFEGKTKEEKDAAAVKKVEEIVAIENSFPGAGRKGSPWRQIGMNPFRHSFFYDRRNGQPVIAAAEVVQIGGLVYAKDVVYADKSDPIFNVDGYKDANGETVRFQIEDRANEEANNEQTYDAVENNSQGLFDADVDAAVDADVSEMDSWKERPRTMFERFIDLTRLKIQDKFRKIIAVQEDIEFSKGAPVGLDEDFRNAEELMHGKAKDKLNKTEIIVGKIVKLIKASGLSIEKFNDLLYAMHAQERNRYLRVISTDIGKSLMVMRKKKGMKPSEVAELLGISTQNYVDIEGNKTALKTSDLADVLLIYGTTPSRFFYDNAKVKDGSGMTDVEARKILAEYGLDLASPDVSQLKPRIAKAVQAVRDLTADTRNRLLESGLETQDAIDAFTATYKNYVPLRGFADGELQSEMIEGGRKLEVRGREKRAKGRTTKADSPLTQVIISNTTTIVRAEKNSIMNRFYTLAVSNPNKDVYEIVDPKVTKEYKREIRNGKIVTTAKTIADYMSDPNMVSVRVGGEYKFIRFKDASLADALKGANVVKAEWMTKYLGAFNRALSSLITTYDPEFVLRNFSRDIQTAVLNLFAEQEMTEGIIKDKSIVAKVVKDVLPAIKSIAIVEGGKSSKNKEMDQYYREFKEDGAKTEWFYSKSSTEVEKDIKNLIEGKGETALQAAGNLVERINSAVENGVRLSAYVNARKAGVSRAKSAELAKNLTVNFNKSGEWGQIGNTLFLFFNASVQGTSRLMRTLKPQYKVDSEGNRSLQISTAQKMAIGLSLMGSIMSLLNELVSDDDEDDKSFYSKIADFEKERNIIIMKPNGKSYWKIPLPYGVNVFYVTGTLLADAAQKIKTPAEVVGGIMQAAVGSFSPINFPNSEDTSKFLMKFVTPTIGQVPLALAINENYFGQTIYNENFPFDTSPKPESELGRKGGNRWTKELTRLLNKISGGSEFRSGSIDINPDAIDFIMESYSGGMGKFVSRSANTVDKIITGNWDQIEPRQVPFLRVFYGQSPKYANVQEFYTRSILVNQMQEEVKAGIISGAEAKRVSKVFYLGKNIRKQLSALKKREDVVMQIKDADVQKEKMKRLEELRYKLVADYNKQYERFEIDKLK